MFFDASKTSFVRLNGSDGSDIDLFSNRFLIFIVNCAEPLLAP